MKKFKITKEQILEVASWGNRQDLVKLREWFPQAFRSELEYGKWYNVKTKGFDNKALICFDNDKLEPNYGFNHIGVFSKNFRNLRECLLDNNQEVEPATDKEVETALIAEAKKRGLVDGAEIEQVKYGGIRELRSGGADYTYFGKEDYMTYFGWTIYSKGQWSKVIKKQIEITLEQIAEKFNVNVEQLKIKK